MRSGRILRGRPAGDAGSRPMLGRSRAARRCRLQRAARVLRGGAQRGRHHRLGQPRAAARVQARPGASSSRLRQGRCGCRSCRFGSIIPTSRAAFLSTAPVYSKWWNDDRVNIVRVYRAARRRSRRKCGKRILYQVGASRRLFVLTNEELRAYILKTHGSVVRHHLYTDRRGGAGGRARHREYLDRVDHRPAARTGRAAGCRRTAQADSADRLDGGARDRSDRPGARLCAGRAFSCSIASRLRGCDLAGMRLTYEYPFAMALMHDARDSRCGVHCGAWLRPKPPCADRWWRHSSMNRFACLRYCAVCSLLRAGRAADRAGGAEPHAIASRSGTKAR